MSGSNIRNYQVNYAINAEGNAAQFFIQMAENANKMQEPLNALQAQIRGISRSLQLLGRNENLKRLFALEPTINLSTLKTGLAEAEKLVSDSAARMASQLNTALANAASLKQTKAKSAVKQSKEEIQALMKDLENQFFKVSGGKKINDKSIRGKDDTTEEAWEVRSLYKKMQRDLNKMGKIPKSAATVLDSVKRAEDIAKTAKAVQQLNESMSAFKHKKLTMTIDANITPAVEKVNTLLNTVRESVAAIPVTLGESKGKKGKSAKTGKTNIAIAESSNVTNLLKGKEKAVSVQANFNGGDAVAQLNQSVTKLQELAKAKPIALRAIFNLDKAGFQLNQAIATLQKLADGKPIVLKATTTTPTATAPVTAAPSNETAAVAATAQTATVKDGKGSTQVKETKWTGPTQSQINAWERHNQSMSDLRINNALHLAKQQEKLAATSHIANQAMYEQLFGREAMHQKWLERDAADESTRARNRAIRRAIANRAALISKQAEINASAHNARALSRLHQVTAYQAFSPYDVPTKTASTPTNRGGYSSRVSQPQGDFYSRSRAFWYPLTGNTSFGARTPMAIDMAKGMGTMFAIGGAMSAVGSSMHQAVEYQNIMKTTNAILKNGTDTYSNGAFKGMEQIVRQVGKDTKFTAPQVASAAKFLAMAGYDIPAINSAIKPVSNIALIGDTDLGATADKLTNVMTTFGIMPEKMNDIADIMTTTFTRSNTDMMMLAESAKYAGGIAHLYGGSFQNNFADVMAMFGVLGNAGIQASSAGTTLRMMYQNLMQPNKKQSATLKQYGIYTRDTKGNPLEMVDILKQIVAKVPANQLADAVGNMFRITAQPGAAALANSLKNGNNSSLLKLMEANRSAAGTGISESIANEKKNTVAGLWAQVTSTFTEGILQAFEGKEGGWAGTLARLRDYLAKPETVDMLKSIVDLVENLAGIMGDFAKAYAKVYSMFPGIINFWMKFQLGATQLDYLMTPIIQLIGALGMLKAAIGGASVAATSATISERAREGGAITSAISGFAPRYFNYRQSGKAANDYAMYQSEMAYWLGKRTTLRNIANVHGDKALSAMKNMRQGNWWAIAATNPTLASAIAASPTLGLQMYAQTYKGSAIANEYEKAVRASKYVQFADKRVSATKSQYFEALRTERRSSQIANSALVNRYKNRYSTLGGDAALFASVVAQRKAYDDRINAISSARHATRGVIDSSVVNRYARTASWGKDAGLAWKNSFSAGQALGAISLAGMLGSIKGAFASLIGGLAKALGLLTSPIGLVTMAIAGLVATAYKIWSNYKQHKDQLELANKNSQWISDSYKRTQSDYLNASIAAGGFSPVSVGYTKQLENEQATYSLEKNNVVAAILDGKTDKLKSEEIYNKYVQGYKYLPNYLITQWKRDSNPLVRGRKGQLSTEELQKSTQKLAIISQWADMATHQSDVTQAMKDLQKAIYDKDFKRAQDIVNAYKPFSKIKMSDISNAKSISEISDPNKYYEWQYAQYKVLEDMWANYNGPAQNYSKAIDILNGLKGKKKSDIQSEDMTSLAQTIMSAIPISFKGTVAQITLDKMGRVDWMALANSVNNGIPFTIGEQQDILKNTYDAIYNDPNIQNFTSVIELLQTYLPKIANERSPYGEYHWTEWGNGNDDIKNDNTNNVTIPLQPKPQKTNYKLFEWGSLIKTPQMVNDFDEAVKKSNGSIVEGTALYTQMHPDNFPQSVTRSQNTVTDKYTRNGTVGGANDKDKNSQKDYKNTYDRSAAHPTQVIINIDNLARFDRTAIAGNSDERAIAEAIENKIAEAVAMISAQALNTAGSLISQGA